MRKPKAKLVAALAAVSAVVAVLAASGALASADGSSTANEVHIYEADTALDGNVGHDILTGAITDHGIDHQGVADDGIYNRLMLSKGSFDISTVNLLANFPPLDPTTCSSDGTETVAVPVVDGTGTGAYQGISGTFQITVTFASILPRLPNGLCNTNATKYPGIEISRGAGTISYK
ncbi:MAG: hypothetical protein ACLQA5_05980 [Solirubrobacteraceae bacterium]